MHSSLDLFCSKRARVLSLGLNRPLFLYNPTRVVSHMLRRLMCGLYRHDEGDTGYINASHLRSKDFEQPEWEYIAAQACPWRLCHCPSRYCMLGAQGNCHAHRNQHRHDLNPFKRAPNILARAHASPVLHW